MEARSETSSTHSRVGAKVASPASVQPPAAAEGTPAALLGSGRALNSRVEAQRRLGVNRVTQLKCGTTLQLIAASAPKEHYAACPNRRWRQSCVIGSPRLSAKAAQVMSQQRSAPGSP